MSGLDVAARERAIMKYLRDAPAQGASVREIYDTVSAQLGDTVSRPAYYKILDRMEATGKLELAPTPGGERRYALTTTLHIGNAITLDDVYEMLPYVETTEALARAWDAQDYYEEHRKTVIKRAAEALLDEDPVDLFCRMILDLVRTVEADIAMLRHKGERGATELADTVTRARLEEDYRALEHVAYRGLSVPHSALRLPGLRGVELGKDVWCDPGRLRQALRQRVFGATFIREVNVAPLRALEARQQLTVSGSDGSIHAGTLALQTAKGYLEDISDIITFNNSAVYIRLSPRLSKKQGRADMAHSAPFTRQTLDDPSYKGMVLAPFMFPDLSESEYEHMARCATDVIQFRVDEEVFTGKAYDLRPPHTQIPRPQVHLRDGTITPQEREFAHYARPDAYGEMVRKGIRRERVILERIITSGERGPIFGGAVKSTQMRVFGHLLNWYIRQGSRARFGAPLEPNWDIARAASITDNAAMTALFSALPACPDGVYRVTCAILRQFPSLTEYYNYDLGGGSWQDFFEEKQREALREHERYGGTLKYHADVDLADDDFIFMCERADYVSFYIGHTAGDPPPMIPRYEFLASLRAHGEDGLDGDETQGDATQAAAGMARRVEGTVERIVDALDAVGLAQDRDHNYLSGKTLIKILPFPIQQAHEYCKTLGRKLEAELKSIVISRLIEIKRLRAAPGDVEVRPVSVKRYLERFARAAAAREQERDVDTR